MRLTSISAAVCSIIFAQAIFSQVLAQTQSTESASIVPAELINSTEAPTSQNKTQIIARPSPVPFDTVTNVTETSQAQQTNSTPAVGIVIDGFVTSTDKVELVTQNDMITMTDPTIGTTTIYNVTDDKKRNISVFIDSNEQEDDLTLSFLSSSSHFKAAEAYLPSALSALVLTTTFIILAVTTYTGLLIWRKVVERRYGNRELLVNEEFYDVNGLKYFEL
ncbi:Hypothetical predicted protein [Cloeon dipterum]|uniref:Uncharacterized protein n=1 Tax=Cloeon dipterum TaxID=197152 RepID=A0A8S1DB39_9INSE|nr:Hypothetical predicted protein [Cloeon dipterum]